MLIETLFNRLFKDGEMFGKIFPHLEAPWFTDGPAHTVFNQMHHFVELHQTRPSSDDIKLLLESDPNVSEEDTQDAYDFLKSVTKQEDEISNSNLLLEAEKWAQDRALELSILQSVEVIKSGGPRGKISDLVKHALSVGFDVKLGHSYFEDAGKRYKSYSEKEEYIPIDIDDFNEALGGGFVKKAMYMILGRCVVGETEITVRNKQNGQIEKITIENFHNKIKHK